VEGGIKRSAGRRRFARTGEKGGNRLRRRRRRAIGREQGRRRDTCKCRHRLGWCEEVQSLQRSGGRRWTGSCCYDQGPPNHTCEGLRGQCSADAAGVQLAATAAPPWHRPTRGAPSPRCSRCCGPCGPPACCCVSTEWCQRPTWYDSGGRARFGRVRAACRAHKARRCCMRWDGPVGGSRTRSFMCPWRSTTAKANGTSGTIKSRRRLACTRSTTCRRRWAAARHGAHVQ